MKTADCLLKDIETGKLMLCQNSTNFWIEVDGMLYSAVRVVSINENSLQIRYWKTPNYRIPVTPKERFFISLYDGPDKKSSVFVYAHRMSRTESQIGEDTFECLDLYAVSAGLAK